ncbi:MAG TPA: bifunctional hydroxymethylpyrimidine kinase/phosphomethylpyrimidine kinase [Vicinamibacterales bacterium]|jgi:hydroxymethylpyrimidine/phosphomethylpyrimidine kinase|nr:bifunctional hydroxymethylpyrimidine kinase/phosphomethylpyrimidine kinase [Vicinamibacterales bacterium]
MHTALTIAGSDSSGGAGIQADLRTFAAFGVRGGTAITAITAQNAHGVLAMAPLSADLVSAQIEAVAADRGIDATKIGMLANAAIVEAVVAAIEDLELPLVVLDPVLASTSGTRLIDADGVQTLIIELLPRVLVMTPNVVEAEALSGRRITSLAGVRDAARRLHDMGAANVVVKGGHLPQLGTPDVVDVLFDGKDFHEARIRRVTTPGTPAPADATGAAAAPLAGPLRGTGCSFAAAVAAALALGYPLVEAAVRAQRHVAGLIASPDVY